MEIIYTSGESQIISSQVSQCGNLVNHCQPFYSPTSTVHLSCLSWVQNILRGAMEVRHIPHYKWYSNYILTRYWRTHARLNVQQIYTNCTSLTKFEFIIIITKKNLKSGLVLCLTSNVNEKHAHKWHWWWLEYTICEICIQKTFMLCIWT